MKKAISVRILLCAGIPASAQEPILETIEERRPQRIDVLLNVNVVGTQQIGGSAWYGYPILTNGLVPEMNDEVILEGGALLERYRRAYYACHLSYTRFTPMIGPRWLVHLTKELGLFALAKVGYGFGFNASSDCFTDTRNSGINALRLMGGVGGTYQIASGFALRVDVTNFGAAGGISFEF